MFDRAIVVSGSTSAGSVAIDDVILLNSNCPLRGHCDFESGWCGYLNDRSGHDQLDWTRDSAAASAQNLGPQFDHTLGILSYYLVT